MNYVVKEMFYTLQGEGAHTGTPAVFVRFTGCNLWSGREEHRERDTTKGTCARWCDTDFRGGAKYTAETLATAARAMWPRGWELDPVVVLTGGEPTLQVDDTLVAALHAVGFRIHMETNGTRPIARGVDWVTLSPKPPSAPLPQTYHEVKVVFDGPDVEQWAKMARQRYLQPLWVENEQQRRENVERCIQYVMAHPHWSLSIQTHKLIGIP